MKYIIVNINKILKTFSLIVQFIIFELAQANKLIARGRYSGKLAAIISSPLRLGKESKFEVMVRTLQVYLYNKALTKHTL